MASNSGRTSFPGRVAGRFGAPGLDPYEQALKVEASSTAPARSSAAAGSLAEDPACGGGWALPIALLALPLIYAIHDLTAGYPGFAHGHAITPRPDLPRDEPRPGDLERGDLGADRDRLHARLRDHRADQLRPRRRVHDRLVHRGRVLGLDRTRPDHRTARAGPRAVADADRVDAGVRLAQRADRAGRLPAAAQRAEARAADHRGRASRSSCRTSACCGSAATRPASTT